MVKAMESNVKETHKELVVGLNANKFEFLLVALSEMIKPVISREKFRVIVEKDPESDDVQIRYQFPE